jgi:cAMP-specific phosphodiesterase
VHHCQLAVELLGHTNLLGGLSHADKSMVFKIIIDSVLATDMAMHNNIANQVETIVTPTMEAFYALPKQARDPADIPAEVRRLIVILALKMADISNVSKEFDTARKWGISIMEEFHAQGDAERRGGMEVTPMFDREQKAELAKGQLGFISFMAKPFFVLGVKCFPDLEYLVKGIDSNVQMWERVLQQHREALARQLTEEQQEEEEDDEEEY